MTQQYLFTSESVSEGHPDKVADQISDAVLDWVLTRDSAAKVACETLIAPSLACVTPSRGGNWVVRHWRGEFDLGVSFWLNGFLLSLVIFAAFYFLGEPEWRIKGPRIIPIVLLALYGSLFCVGLWQMVGIWNSAVRHKAVTGRTFWAGLVQFSVIVWALSENLGVALEVIPRVQIAFQVAKVVSDIPHYDFHVLRDGTEAEISGGIGYGIADDFEKLLAQYPNIKTVHLYSGGGLVEEGERLAGIFRSHGIKTYVPMQCLSACTDAFLGGRERYLKSGARLGFHQPTSQRVVLRSPEFYQMIVWGKRYLMGQGVLPTFAEQAMSTPNDDMWFPTQDELIRANVVTAVTSGDEFALSGFDWSNQRRDQIEKGLQKYPWLQALKEKQPATYQRYFAIIDKGISKGMSNAEEAEVRSEMRSLIHEIIQKQLPYASDKVVLDYTRLLLDEVAQFERVSPVLCVDFVYVSNADINYWQYLTRETYDQYFQILADIITSADPKRTLPKDTQISPLLKKARSLMRERTGEDAILIDKITTTESRAAIGPAKTCKVAAALYNGVLELPPEQAATALRYLFGTFDDG